MACLCVGVGLRRGMGTADNLGVRCWVLVVGGVALVVGSVVAVVGGEPSGVVDSGTTTIPAWNFAGVLVV